MKTPLTKFQVYSAAPAGWLEQIPSHWNLLKLKHIASNIVIQADKIQDDERYLSLQHVEGWTGAILGSGHNEDFSGQVKRFRHGDVLFGKLRPYLAKVTRPNFDGVCVGEFLVIRTNPELCLSEYLERVLRSAMFISLVNASTQGAKMPRAEWNVVGSLLIPVPPLPEQRLIARYCAHLDARVNRLVRAKRRLIALLTEQKQAVIQQAVTRGLDPGAPMKPSGVSSVGDVPANWSVEPFVRTVAERSDYRGATPEKVDSGVLLVTAKNVRMGYIDYDVSQEFIRSEQYDKVMRRGLPKRGDLLLTTEAPLGNVALVDREDIALAQRIIRFRFDPASVDAQFGLYATMSKYFQDQLHIRATGSTAHGIKASKIPQLVLVIPGLSEQRLLVDYLNGETSQIDLAIGRIVREIDLIREYRTRLVADVVTGQLDVRAAAAALPDVDPLDDAGDDAGPDLGDLTDDDLDPDAADPADEMPDAAD